MAEDISDLSEGLQLLIKRNRLNAIEIRKLRAGILEKEEGLGEDRYQKAKAQADEDYSEIEGAAHGAYLQRVNIARSACDATVAPKKEAYGKAESEARALRESAIATATRHYENTIGPLKKELDAAEESAKRVYDAAQVMAEKEYNDTVEKAKTELRVLLLNIKKEMRGKGFKLVKVR